MVSYIHVAQAYAKIRRRNNFTTW